MNGVRSHDRILTDRGNGFGGYFPFNALRRTYPAPPSVCLRRRAQVTDLPFPGRPNPPENPRNRPFSTDIDLVGATRGSCPAGRRGSRSLRKSLFLRSDQGNRGSHIRKTSAGVARGIRAQVFDSPLPGRPRCSSRTPGRSNAAIKGEFAPLIRDDCLLLDNRFLGKVYWSFSLSQG